MIDFLEGFFATEGFHPHGYCYLWKPGLIWLHVIADVLIGVAYVAIGVALAYFVRHGRSDIPFSRMFVAFGVFIAACGATHFVEVWTLWTPAYWFAGSVKAVTAVASVFTALALPPLVPIALGTVRSAKLSERHRQEREAAHAELNAVYERLKESDEAKTRFFANVSHELRTPLTLILGPAERLLASGDLSDADRRQVETVRRNANLLLRHVNELLDVSMLQAGQMEMHYTRLDLARLTRRAAAHFESFAGERGVRFTVEVPASVPAEVDADKIEGVLFNLLGNAVKFTPAGGRIRLELTTRPGSDPSAAAGAGVRGRIAVHDSGPGVAPGERDRVFEAFRQGEEGTARRFGGTGLGLTIVRDFVELHGGTVRVADSPEGGALFSVDLPLRAPKGAELPGDGVEPVNTEREALDGPGVERWSATAPSAETREDDDRPRVLVVEDNPEMNRFVSEALAADCRVAHAFNGAEGLEKAREFAPDLILSDVMMPEVSGDVLVREVRRDSSADDVPILLLSARADDELRVRLLREGAQDYLTKPFSVEELQARVRNWIGVKRARDILRRELEGTLGDVEMLATEVAHRKRELEAALEVARQAAETAEAASRAKSDFLSVMSHELRTPLNAIVGYADLLDAEIGGPLTETQRGHLTRIRKGADHLLHLIEEILTFSRIEAAREEVHLQTVDVADLVREATALLAPVAESKDLALRVEVPDEAVILETDPHMVRQILLNLLSNAIKFTEQGQVVASVEAGAEGVRIRVGDTGPGIPAEQWEKIFEPFWQADPSKTRRAEGTGLGLSIARRLARLLDGEVQVESTPGEGSTFTLWLPVSRPPS